MHKYLNNNVFKQAPNAHERAESFFEDLLISFKGEGVLDNSIQPTRFGTVLYTRLARGLQKIENCSLYG